MNREKTYRDWWLAVALGALNAIVARELFGVEFSRHMGSIESTHITISRYILEAFPDFGWFALWYNGIPFQNTYPPFLHLVVALYGALTGASAAQAHHAVTAAAYSLGPVTLFALARALGMQRTPAFLSGLFFSLTSFSAWLIPVVRQDVGGFFNARRLQALVQYGEGPHVTSITLLALALLLLHLALRRGAPLLYLAAAAGLASAVLTNWLGGFSLAAAVAAYLFTEHPQQRWVNASRTLATGAAAYLAVSPWIPTSTLKAIRTNSQWIGGEFQLGWRGAVSGLLMLIVMSLGVWLMRKRDWSRSTQFAVLFFVVMGGLVLPAEFAKWYIVPQPQRYHLQMEMALSLLAAAGVSRLLRSRRIVTFLVAIALTAGLAWQFVNYRKYARSLIGSTEISKTIEFRAAKWLEAKMAGQRVMMAGTVGFWLNAFSNTPQLAGGFDQGITNPFLPHVLFQILSGMGAGDREAQTATSWLQAYGVHAVGVSGPQSSEVYKPFANPRKFDGFLEEVWREDDFHIYAVPHGNASLARVLPRQALVTTKPRDVFDLAQVNSFVAAGAAGREPEATLSWRNRNTAQIEARVPRGYVVSVAISYHPGWRATVTDHAGNAKTRKDWPVPLFEDGLGLLAMDPACEGECTVLLQYDGGVEMFLMRLLSGLTLFSGFAWAVTSWWKTRKAR